MFNQTLLQLVVLNITDGISGIEFVTFNLKLWFVVLLVAVSVGFYDPAILADCVGGFMVLNVA